MKRRVAAPGLAMIAEGKYYRVQGRDSEKHRSCYIVPVLHQTECVDGRCEGRSKLKMKTAAFGNSRCCLRSIGYVLGRSSIARKLADIVDKGDGDRI